jgi:peptidoglycan hydrolase-like protein with peptidoglycan-binding domain
MSDGSAAAGVQTAQVNLVLPILRQGGGPRSAVSRLQAIFNDLARADDGEPPFDESGIFGPKTDHAVREFQEDNGLHVDGDVGKNTWTALLNQWMTAEPPD